MSSTTRDEMAAQIRAKVIELAKEIGKDAALLKNDQHIPDSGYLDSAAIMGLIAWYEMEFDLDIPQEDVTLDNFGSVNLMVEYILRRDSKAR